MVTLRISVTLLDHLFHGRGDNNPEWPPSPWRLFQSILASAARNHIEQAEDFLWFEKLEHPRILAPEVNIGKRWKTYVPDNASDAYREKKDYLSEKIIHPVMINGGNRTLHYLYSILPEDREMAMRIIEYAKLITSLGWGIDLAVGDGEILSKDQVNGLIQRYSGIYYTPSTHAGITNRCPSRGSYIDLKEVHETKLNRFRGTIYIPPKKPTVFEGGQYVENGAVFRHFSLYKLLQLDEDVDRWARVDPRNAIYLSSWVRGQLCSHAKMAWTFEEDSEQYVAGHHDDAQSLTPPRFSYLPIPTVGHPHADGLIRRIIVAEPYGGDGRKARWVERVLDGNTLHDDSGKSIVKIRFSHSDSVTGLYCNPSFSYRTVTPMVLPGHDSFKYRKAEKLFLKAVTQAGFDPNDIESYILQKGPFFRGCYHANVYKRTDHLMPFSTIHASVTWKKKMYGPLALGAGRHRGLGLFIGFDKRFAVH